MKVDIKKLITEAKEEIKQDIATGKLKLKEYESGDEDKYEAIANRYATPEILSIIKKWDNLGFDLPGEAVNTILLQKTWDKDYDVTDANPADLKKVQDWKKATIQKYKSTAVKELTVVPTQGGKPVPSAMADVNAAKRSGDVIKYVDKSKMNSSVMEKKSTDKEDTEPVEPQETEEAPAEETPSTPSAELQAHIAAAIDSAAKCLGANQDRKYEAIIGKITAQLTKAQDYLGDLQTKETELAEQAEANKTVELDKYFKAFIKALRKYTKDEALISKITKIYKPIAAKFMEKEMEPTKAVDEIWKHFVMNEAKK